MDIQGFFTKKGLLLAAKLAAGSTLKITRVCAGAAETALTASALSQIRQTLSVGAARRSGETAVLPVTLEAGMAGSAYSLRELGVYAQDPDEGEILYKVYRLSEPVAVTPSSRLVLRFYLEETVSQDLNVTVVRASAGLLTEADLEPVRARVEAKSIPTRSVEVAAAELPAYIASLPRLRTELLRITVTAGTIPGRLTLSGFYGPGSIWISGSGSIVSNGISVVECYNYIRLMNFDVRNQEEDYAVSVSGTPLVSLENFVIDGKNVSETMNGISCSYSSVYAANTTLNGLSTAVYCIAGTATVQDAGASGNAAGITASTGSLVYLTGSTPEMLGGAAHNKGGGLIVKDGRLL